MFLMMAVVMVLSVRGSLSCLLRCLSLTIFLILHPPILKPYFHLKRQNKKDFVRRLELSPLQGDYFHSLERESWNGGRMLEIDCVE